MREASAAVFRRGREIRGDVLTARSWAGETISSIRTSLPRKPLRSQAASVIAASAAVGGTTLCQEHHPLFNEWKPMTRKINFPFEHSAARVGRCIIATARAGRTVPALSRRGDLTDPGRGS